MKNKYILGGFAALTALASSASADQTIDITGATAFRTAAVDSIIASFGAGLDDFAHTGAAGLTGIRGARQSIFKGDFPGLPDKTIIRCTWTGSVEGIQTVANSIESQFEDKLSHDNAASEREALESFAVQLDDLLALLRHGADAGLLAGGRTAGGRRSL